MPPRKPSSPPKPRKPRNPRKPQPHRASREAEAAAKQPTIGRIVEPAQVSQLVRRRLTLAVQRISPLLRIAHTLQSPQLIIRQRIIYDHELVLIHQGQGRLRIANETFPLSANTLVLIEPFVPHTFDCHAEDGLTKHTALHFDLSSRQPGQVMQLPQRQPYRVELSHGLSLPQHLKLDRHHPLLDQFAQLVHAWQSSSPLGQLRATHLLQGILLHLLEQPAAQSASPLDRHRPQMEKVLRHIHEHHADAMRLSDMAAIAGLSRAHFVRIFTQWTGHKPAQYLQRTRIARAARLMAQPDAPPLKQIAYMTGFANPYHFARVFKRIEGMPPGLFRQSLLGSAQAKTISRP